MSRADVLALAWKKAKAAEKTAQEARRAIEDELTVLLEIDLHKEGTQKAGSFSVVTTV
jgi:hypothetical protein